MDKKEKSLDSSNSLIKLVRVILAESEELRDNDAKLVTELWRKQISANPEITTYSHFFQLYENGKVYSSDTITRCRRKLQEEHEELRGTSYEARQRFSKKVADQATSSFYKNKEERDKARSEIRAIIEKKRIEKEQLALSKNESNKTVEFFSEAVNGLHKPLLREFSFDQDISKEALREIYNEFQKYKGQFDSHIETSIPGFRETQLKKVIALKKAYADYPYHNAPTALDIGGSEGGFVKLLSDKFLSINLDINDDMEEAFNRTPPDEVYRLAAFVKMAFYEDVEVDGKIIPKYVPFEKMDVVHESMVFQFITDRRDHFIKHIKEDLLLEDGLLLLEEKFRMVENTYQKNEELKNEYKKMFYTEEQLKFKTDHILVGMKENQAYIDTTILALSEHFKYTRIYWKSGNFMGIAASSNLKVLTDFLAAFEGI